ncbi:hypothetical protein ACN6MY_20690 [Peribacillus sp. B-H-3]|uniref:hypothetical protein n=1 Tax=Peribacillus sp. B-H-3 TaxID=3400420 RepID=UPI003B02921C
MFFKHSSKIDLKAVNIAYAVTFAFWGFTLLLNSVFEWYYKGLALSSLTILAMGLVIFFLTEWMAAKIKKIKG